MSERADEYPRRLFDSGSDCEEKLTPGPNSIIVQLVVSIESLASKSSNKKRYVEAIVCCLCEGRVELLRNGSNALAGLFQNLKMPGCRV